MAPRVVAVDALVLGGGIAGLWTLARLRAEGFHTVLLEAHALGGGQTIASQGIIHGGVKYALGGSVGDASRAIAEMPALWRACLGGAGPVDLRAVRVLSETQCLWTARGMGARLMGLAASKSIRAGVSAIARAERPEGFRGAPAGIDVYAVPEPVLEPRSLVEAIASPHERRCLRFDSHTLEVATKEGEVAGVECTLGGEAVRIEAGLTVLCAGEGNEAPLDNAAAALGVPRSSTPPMQRRPLHMVIARERSEGTLPPMYAHAVGMASGPLATVTSQRDSSGRRVWWIGGGIAESGVERSPVEQVKHTMEQLNALAPWIDWSVVDWATVRIDRAELRTESGRRPEGPAAIEWAGCAVCWPSKLAFAPVIADQVLEIARRRSKPTGGNAAESRIEGASLAPVARLPWEREDLQWF